MRGARRAARASVTEPDPLPVMIAHRGDGQEARIVEGKELALRSRLVDRLAKETLLVEQTDPHHRHSEVVGRLEVVPGHVSAVRPSKAAAPRRAQTRD